MKRKIIAIMVMTMMVTGCSETPTMIESGATVATTSVTEETRTEQGVLEASEVVSAETEIEVVETEAIETETEVLETEAVGVIVTEPETASEIEVVEPIIEPVSEVVEPVTEAVPLPTECLETETTVVADNSAFDTVFSGVVTKYERLADGKGSSGYNLVGAITHRGYMNCGDKQYVLVTIKFDDGYVTSIYDLEKCERYTDYPFRYGVASMDTPEEINANKTFSDVVAYEDGFGNVGDIEYTIWHSVFPASDTLHGDIERVPVGDAIMCEYECSLTELETPIDISRRF